MPAPVASTYPILYDDGLRYRPLLTINPPATATHPQAEARSLRRRLRSESRTSHEALDARFHAMADAPGTEVYARFLRLNEACHRAVEPILEASPLSSIAPAFVLKHRAPVLARDLESMGLEPIEPPAFPIERPDAAETVGIVYVLEGSRLGAGYILARLKERDLGDAWSGASFAYLEDQDEPHALRSFLAEASLALDEEADVSRAVHAAEATFRYFLDVEGLSRLEIAPGEGS